MITSEYLIKLRESLPSHNLKILSVRTGFSPTYIWQVLNGKRQSQDIIDAAVALAKETKERLETSKNDIANL